MPLTFSTEYAYQVLQRACYAVGETSEGATMLRLGENAIFRLAGRSSSIVVRVARDFSRLEIARRELCVSRWLNSTGGVPATSVHEEIPDQPVVIDGHPVTFWRYVPPTVDAPTMVDLATLLRSLHRAREAPCEMRAFDPLGTVRSRLIQGLGLAADDLAFLRSRCEAIERQLSDLTYALPPGPIHGDAHTGNLLGHSGHALLADFEMFATGPREWDLVPAAVAVARFGLAPVQWEQFVAAYGFDVRTWSGYPVLREARELGMTTWLAQNATESEAILKEVRLRIQSLRDGDLERVWTAF